MKSLVLCTLLFVSPSLFAKAEIAKPESTALNTNLQVSIPELRKMQAKLQTHKFLSLDFQQTVFKKLRKKTITNRGDVYFAKPSSFRWTFQHPEAEEWIYDGSSLFHYFPKKNYAYRYKAQAKKGKNLREIVNIVLDFDSLLRRYDVVSSIQEKNLVRLDLNPKALGEITQVHLILDLEKNLMKEVKLDFEGGNHSVFAFSNPRHTEIKNGFSLGSKVKITDPI